jgi:hypothetical protein
MSSGSNRFRSVRWSLLFAFVRAAAATLALFVGLVWSAYLLYERNGGGIVWTDGVSSFWIGVVVFAAGVVAVLSVGISAGFLESRARLWRS